MFHLGRKYKPTFPVRIIDLATNCWMLCRHCSSLFLRHSFRKIWLRWEYNRCRFAAAVGAAIVVEVLVVAVVVVEEV